MDRFAEMQIFKTVVEAGSISAAAVRAGTTKSVVSHRVAELEARLRTLLLHRGPRRVTLTEAGTAFYEQCVRILAELDAAEESIDAQGAPRGTLRVAAPLGFSLLHLNPLFTELARRYPDLRISADLDDRMVDIVGEGYEVAVRIGALPDSSLRMRRVAPNKIVTVGAPSYLAERGVPTRLEELEHHDGIMRSNRQPTSMWRYVVDGELRGFPIRPRLMTNSGELMLEAARAGLGLALLPTFMAAEPVKRGELRIVLPEFEYPGGHIHAVMPANRFVSARVTALVTLLLERFSPVPPWDRELELASASRDRTASARGRAGRPGTTSAGRGAPKRARDPRRSDNASG